MADKLNLICSILQMQNVPQLAVFMQALSQAIISYVETGIKSDEIQSLEEKFISISAEANKLDIENNEILQLAYLLGYLKSNYDIVNLRKKETKKDNRTELINKYKHLEKVLDLLYHQHSLDHTQLCEQLDIEKSALSNMFDQLTKHDLFITREYGKRKYYYLSTKGKNLYLQNMKSKSVSSDSNTKFVLRLVDNINYEITSPCANVNRLIKNLVEIDDGVFVTKPKLLKNKLNRLVLSINYQRKYSNLWNIYIIDMNARSSKIEESVKKYVPSDWAAIASDEQQVNQRPEGGESNEIVNHWIFQRR